MLRRQLHEIEAGLRAFLATGDEELLHVATLKIWKLVHPAAPRMAFDAKPAFSADDWLLLIAMADRDEYTKEEAQILTDVGKSVIRRIAEIRKKPGRPPKEREAVIAALEALYEESQMPTQADKETLYRVNNRLLEQGFRPVSPDTLGRAIETKAVRRKGTT
jgi:hypothetical protein